MTALSFEQGVLRFFAALALLALGPQLLYPTVSAWTGLTGIEGGMTCMLLATLGVVAMAHWWPPGRPFAPWPLAAVARTYAWFALAWTPLLIVYLRWLRPPAQPALGYLAAADWLQPGTWIVVAAIVIGAPVAEELTFRGYLQGGLSRRLPPHVAIVISAVVFDLVHTLAYAFPITLLGLLLGWLYERHRSLGASVLAHAVHNGLTVAVVAIWPDVLHLLYPS